MLGYLEVYFIILIYSIILTILLKKRIEEVLPISIVEIVLIIYVFGLVNQLKLGIITIEILTIVQFLILLGIIIKNGKNIIHNILTPGLLIYTFLFFTSVIVNRNRIFEDYDEFNHWGLIVKNMFLYNTFGMNGREVVTFNEYPPFTAIFQYLFVMIQKIYKEDAIIIAHNILYFSIVIPITKTIKWNKNIIKMFVIIPVIIFLPLIFYENFYLDILVDGIIGIMFAYVIFSAFEKEENTKFKYLKILTGEIMLILTKTTSIALALLSITIIILEKIIFGLKLNKEKTKKEIKAIVIIFFIMVILISTWFLKMNGAKKRWDFQQIIKPESYSIKKVDTIFNKFIKEFFLNENITARKFTVFSIILLLVSIHIYNYKRIKTKEIKYYGLAMLINIVLWSFGMLFVYITIFDHKEAIELTCFERYISTILLANTTFQIFVMLSTDFKKCWSNLIIMLFILYTFLPFNNIEKKYIEGNTYIAMSNTNRYIYTQIREYKKDIKENDKILYIVGSKVNLEYLTSMINYEIMPIKLDKAMKANFDDIDDFKNNVKKYEYVFIYQIENEQKEKIKDVFENKKIETSALYRVKNEDNKIELNLMTGFGDVL